MSRFKQAVRTRSRLRLALDGPPGSGKSWSSLVFAHALIDNLRSLGALEGNGEIAAIDTERGSLSKYVGTRLHAEAAPWNFFVSELSSFAPTEYTSAINDAGRAGYSVLIVDSLSHAWAGKDGALAIKDQLEGNSYTAWKTVTPMHNAMIDAILQSPCHVIVTMRSKVEHVLETNEQGKQVPRRVGMAPVQRNGMEYEFDLYGSMDWSHILTVMKSRCPDVADLIIPKPSASFIEPVARWLVTGESGVGLAQTAAGAAFTLRRLSDETLRKIVGLANRVGETATGEALRRVLMKRYSVGELADLRPEQGEDFVGWLEGQLRLRGQTTTQVQAVASAQAAATNGASGASTGQSGNANTNANTDEIPEPKPGKATREQLLALKRLRTVLVNEYGMTAEDWKRALTNRSVETALDLTPEQADEFIGKLRSRINVRQMEEGLNEPATGSPGRAVAESEDTKSTVGGASV